MASNFWKNWIRHDSRNLHSLQFRNSWPCRSSKTIQTKSFSSWCLILSPAPPSLVTCSRPRNSKRTKTPSWTVNVVGKVSFHRISQLRHNCMASSLSNRPRSLGERLGSQQHWRTRLLRSAHHSLKRSEQSQYHRIWTVAARSFLTKSRERQSLEEWQNGWHRISRSKRETFVT